MRKNKLLIFLLVVAAMIGLASCGEKESFTISFDTAGGSKIEDITVLENGTITAPTAPTRDGYNFAGWYLDAELTNPIEDFASFIIEGNVTLYAKWEASIYTVTFELNGGTGTAAPQTVKYGEKVILPTGLTKEGYKLKAWYKDAALTIPFIPSAGVTGDLKLYAKWESLFTYSGTNSGNATYNPEDGTYSFTSTLGLYNRFSFAYNGQLLSADPEGDLIITGAFTTENQAGWDENLYCDVPDGAEAGTPIDYTTFICSSSRSVNYTVTYDPATNTLDIQAEFAPDEYEIPEKGLFYLIRDNNRLLNSYSAVEANEDGTYSVKVELSQWWRLHLHFDGVEIDVDGQAADIKGDFGTWAGRDNPKSLYSDHENDGPYAFISSYDGTAEYLITYVPATETEKAYVIIDVDPETEPYDPSLEDVIKTSFTVDVASDTALAVWTEAGTVFRDSAAGSWGPLANGWRLICIVDADGKIVYFTLNIANGFGSVGEEGTTFYAHPDYATNNPAYKSTDAGWTVTLPEGCFAITGHSDKALNLILALTGKSYESSDAAQVEVNNMNAIAETARVAYDAENAKINVTGGGAGEQPEDQPKELTPAKTNEDAGGDAFALWTTAGTTFHTPAGWNNNGWRLFVVVDAEGRIAYLVVNAPNGYGGPSGEGYYANGYYSDYTKNPAIQILEGYGPWVKDDPLKASDQFNIVIPEGGFGISAHGSATASLLASFANDANVSTADGDVNKRGILDDNLRLSVVEGKLVVSEAKAEEPEQPTPEQPEVNPNVPAQGLGFEYSYGAEGTDIAYCEEGDIVANEDGTYTFILEIGAWRYIKLYWNGVALDTATTLDKTLSGSLYIGDAPDPTDRIYSNANAKVQFVFTPATDSAKAKVVAGPYVEPVVELPTEFTPAKTNEDAGGEAFALWTTAGTTFHTPAGWNSNGWRLFVVVDAEGKIAYLVVNAPNGYGGPSGDGYYANSDYSDYTKNPAIQILEGFGPWVKDDPLKASEQYNIVIPEGGFGISAHGSATKSLLASFANNANVSTADGDVNKRGALDDGLRLSIVEGKLVIERELSISYTHSALGTVVWEANEDGIYEVTLDFALWGNIEISVNGVKLTDADYTGDAKVGADDGSKLYVDAAGQTKMFCNKAGSFKLTYDVETGKVNVEHIAFAA